MRARHRVSKLLLVHGRVYPEPTTWNREHRRWLGRQQLRARADRAGVRRPAGRRRRAASRARRRSTSGSRGWRRTSGCGRRSRGCACFRGIDTLTALALHLELGGDWQRFGSPRKLFALAGADAVAASSPASPRRRARSPRPAPAIARRLLVESAWHYTRPPADRRHAATTARPASPTTCCRSPGAPSTACTALHHRLRERGKPHNVATVAVARELAGFLWAAATAP